jgi:uncharacterized damage-inducible protein DinB
MDIAHQLRELVRHMAWADGVVWKAMLRSDAAREDGRLRMWLYHIHTVQQAFLQVWREETPAFREPAEFSDLLSLARWGRDGLAACGAFVEAARAEALAREVRVPWAGEVEAAWARTVHNPTLGQTVMQVALHSTHHRGQVSARLRELGGAPPISDYIAWIWLGQPEASWGFLDQPVPGGRAE